MRKTVLGLSIAATSLLAGESFLSGGAIGAKVGTLGLGAEYTMKYNDKIDARFGINGYNYDSSGTKSGIDYNIDLELQTITAIADYHPYSSGFRISGGLVLNNNKLDFKGKPTGTSYNINGTIYNTGQVGSLDGEVDFNNIAPYIGIGYSNATKSQGWSFTADIGAMYQGSPNANLSVTCGAGLPAAQCTALRADVSAEQTQLQNDLDGYDWYPVVSVGVVYKF